MIKSKYCNLTVSIFIVIVINCYCYCYCTNIVIVKKLAFAIFTVISHANKAIIYVYIYNKAIYGKPFLFFKSIFYSLLMFTKLFNLIYSKIFECSFRKKNIEKKSNTGQLMLKLRLMGTFYINEYVYQ